MAWTCFTWAFLPPAVATVFVKPGSVYRNLLVGIPLVAAGIFLLAHGPPALCAKMFSDSKRVLPKDQTPQKISRTSSIGNDGNHRYSLRTIQVDESTNSRRKILLGVAVIKPATPDERVPLLLLPGGPGDSWITHLDKRLPFLTPLASGRRILIVDQRGTGTSKPLLTCPSPIRRPVDLEHCFDACNADFDLASYTTEASARDLAMVLDELSIERVVIFGVSYGTRLALQFSENFPERVAALILDSPIPLRRTFLPHVGKNAEAALELLLEACSLQESCKPLVPEGIEGLARLTIELDKKTSPQWPSGQEFISNISQFMYSTDVLPYIPLLIERAERKDFSLYKSLLPGFSGHPFSWGAHLSIQCAEAYDQKTGPQIDAIDASVRAPFRAALSASDYVEYCNRWRVPRRNLKTTPIKIAHPTLILSGRYDPVTPSSYAHELSRALSNSKLLSFSTYTHGAALNPCGAQRVAEFLVDDSFHFHEDSESLHPHSKLKDSPCLDEINSLQFSSNSPSPARFNEIIAQMRYRL